MCVCVYLYIHRYANTIHFYMYRYIDIEILKIHTQCDGQESDANTIIALPSDRQPSRHTHKKEQVAHMKESRHTRANKKGDTYAIITLQRA